MSDSYSIGTLAKAAGIGVETIRYYQLRQLIRQPPRRYGRIRRYGAGDLERLRFIKRLQSAGFSLAEIEALIQLQRQVSCEATRRMVANRLLAVERRLIELRSLRDELVGWVAQCDANTDDSQCPTLEALGSGQLAWNSFATIPASDKRQAKLTGARQGMRRPDCRDAPDAGDGL